MTYPYTYLYYLYLRLFCEHSLFKVVLAGYGRQDCILLKIIEKSENCDD